MIEYKKEEDTLIIIDEKEKKYNIPNLLELKKGIIYFLENSQNIDEEHTQEYNSLKISQEEELEKINNLLKIYNNL